MISSRCPWRPEPLPWRKGILVRRMASRQRRDVDLYRRRSSQRLPARHANDYVCRVVETQLPTNQGIVVDR
jgi:hypothetical protein